MEFKSKTIFFFLFHIAFLFTMLDTSETTTTQKSNHEKVESITLSLHPTDSLFHNAYPELSPQFLFKLRLHKDRMKLRDVSNMLMASTNSNDDDRKYGDYDFDFPVSPGGPYWKTLYPELVFEYFTVLKISRSPAIKYVLLVDTGSSLTWIQCLPCDLCFKQVSPIFNPKRSLSYKVRSCGDHTSYKSRCGGCNERGECTYDIRYGDKSYSRGVLGEEVCRFGLHDDIEMTFPIGCAHSSNGSFNGSDGMLGLGRGELSFASQMERTYGFKKFSYCLLDKSMKAEPSMYSSLTFGPHVLDPYDNNAVYTPMIQNPKSPKHYFINLTSISVAGKLIPIHTSLPHGIIIDSGTTLTWLPKLTYEAVRDAYRDAALQLNWERVDYSPDLETCYDLGAYIGVGGIDWVTTPEVILYFTGYDKAVEINMTTQNILVTIPWTTSDIYCLGLVPSKSEGTGILGNVQQQGIRVVYDNDQSAIGFDPLSC